MNNSRRPLGGAWDAARSAPAGTGQLTRSGWSPTRWPTQAREGSSLLSSQTEPFGPTSLEDDTKPETRCQGEGGWWQGLGMTPSKATGGRGAGGKVIGAGGEMNTLQVWGWF